MAKKDEFSIRQMFPRKLEDMLLRLCRKGEKRRNKIMALRDIPENNSNTRNNGGPEDLLRNFYKERGYWAVMVDALVKKGGEGSKSLQFKFTEKVKEKERWGDTYNKYDQETTVNCVNEWISLNGSRVSGDLMSREWYEHRYPVYHRMEIAYSILYRLDPERFASIKELPGLIAEYEKALVDEALKEGIEKIGVVVDVGTYGKQRINLQAWKIPDEYSVTRSSYYGKINIDDEMKKSLHMVGEIELTEYQLRFAIIKENNEFKTLVYDIDMENFACMRDGGSFIAKPEHDILLLLPKIQKAYHDEESKNLGIVRKVTDAVKRKNKLSARIKRIMMKLKKDEKEVINRYLACKKVDGVV